MRICLSVALALTRGTVEMHDRAWRLVHSMIAVHWWTILLQHEDARILTTQHHASNHAAFHVGDRSIGSRGLARAEAERMPETQPPSTPFPVADSLFTCRTCRAPENGPCVALELRKWGRQSRLRSRRRQRVPVEDPESLDATTTP